MNATSRLENGTPVEPTPGTWAAGVGLGLWVLGMLCGALGGYGFLESGESRLALIPHLIIAVTALIAFVSPVGVTKLEQCTQVMRWQVAAFLILVASGLPVVFTAGSTDLEQAQINNVGLAVVLAGTSAVANAVGLALTKGKVTALQEQRARTERQELAEAIGVAVGRELSSTPQQTSLWRRIWGRPGHQSPSGSSGCSR